MYYTLTEFSDTRRPLSSRFGCERKCAVRARNDDSTVLVTHGWLRTERRA